MSLINCSECGKEFSNNAPACPNCGQPTSFNYINKDKSKSNELSDNIKDEEVSGEKANIDDKQKEYTDDKGSGGKVIIIVLILASLFFFGNSHVQKNKAIELVDDDYGVFVRRWVKEDPEAVTIYGWEAERVAGKTYFVSFQFDNDNIKGNGYFMYSYEASLDSGIVRVINENPSLKEKYVRMGYMSE
jgi:predicted  nucleic acid-binding Zn-ribbon protein